MARILYGVHGTGHGHAVRALTVARHFPQHEFLFVSHGTGAALLRQEYPVEECPGLVTVFRHHRVEVAATLHRNLKVLLQGRGLLRRILDILDRFQPEVAISDYEFFLPRACRRVGLPCLSLDHQHIVTCCRHPVPLKELPNYLMTYWPVKFLFSQASHYLVTSFYQPPLRLKARARLLAPLLRESVLGRQPRDGEHVVAYQGYSTFKRFFPFLSAIPRPVVVYGFDEERTEGNLHFKRHSEAGFLEDLSSCHYVVCGGGHSLISEALFYGKPVFSFPVKNTFEQFLNAFYVQRLAYGKYFAGFQPPPELIPAFEGQLDHFRRHLRQGNFCGNQEIFTLVARFISHKRLDP